MSVQGTYENIFLAFFLQLFVPLQQPLFKQGPSSSSWKHCSGLTSFDVLEAPGLFCLADDKGKFLFSSEVPSKKDSTFVFLNFSSRNGLTTER